MAEFERSALEFVCDMGPGWNLGNGLDAYDDQVGGNETAWGNPVITPQLIQMVKNAGFKTIRVCTSYMRRIGPGPEYTIDPAWLNRIQEVVNYVMDAGLYAIINIHADGNHQYQSGAWLHIDDPDQEAVRVKFRRVWEQIAARYTGYGEKLVFESMNEAMEYGNYGTPQRPETYPNINALNQIFIDVVRASGGNNSNRYVLMPGYNTDIYSTAVFEGFVLPNDTAQDKMIVSVHFYDPYDFTLNEQNDNIFAWGQRAIDAGNPHALDWHNEGSVRQSMSYLVDAFISRGVPVIVGEYGAVDKSFVDLRANDYRRYFIEFVTKSILGIGALSVIWDNGWNGNYGLGLFDRNTYTVTQPEIIAGIMRAASGEDYEPVPPTE